MSKAKEIESIRNLNKRLKEDIESNNRKIEELLTMKEQSISYMIQEYENDNSNVVTKVQSVEKYAVILGGDGRSSPWDKEYEGKVLKVNYKGIYLTEEDKNKFKRYIIATKPKNIDAIKLNDVQITD